MIDYEYYSNVYYGDKVSDGRSFSRYVGKAERAISNIIGYSIHNIKDEDLLDMVKFTICELVDHYDVTDKIGNVDDFSLGDFRVSTSNTATSIIREGLAGTELVATPNYRPLGRL